MEHAHVTDSKLMKQEMLKCVAVKVNHKRCAILLKSGRTLRVVRRNCEPRPMSSVFLSFVSIVTRDIDIGLLSVT